MLKSVDRTINKYVGPPYRRGEMYAGHVTCCHIVSHVEYAPRAPYKCQKKCGTDRQTDGPPDRYNTLTARRGQRNEQ